MPRLKEHPKPYAELGRLLRGYELSTGPALGAVIRLGEQAALARLRDPGKLTVRELGMICRNAGIPAEEIRAAIRFP